ncbi:arsenate reductase ArsC [bacterium]|nr:arsenate reductase ArsC [bacterium]
MSDKRNAVLFLCVANSARSQMAEGFARGIADPGVEVFSAGSAPSSVNPYAVEVMREAGIDISNARSKSIDEIPMERVGFVVTICADEVCPAVPGDVLRYHLPVPDPAGATGSRETILKAFREARDMVRLTVDEFFFGEFIEMMQSPRPKSEEELEYRQHARWALAKEERMKREREFKKVTKEAAVDALKRVGAAVPCRVCGSHDLEVMPGFWSNAFARETGVTVLGGGNSMPTIVTVCPKCGLTSQYALHILFGVGPVKWEVETN